MKTLVLYRATLLTLCATAALSPLCHAQDMAQQNVPAATKNATASGAPASGAPATNPVGDKLALRLRLKAGQSYAIRSNREDKQMMTFRGQKMEDINASGHDMRYDVLSVDEAGNIIAKATYTGVRMMMNTPTGKVEYDSAVKGTKIPEVAMGRALLVGQSYQVTLSPQGRVLKVENSEAMVKNILDGITEMKMPAPLRQMMQEQMKASYSGENLKKSVETDFQIYTDTPVGIGATWSRITTDEAFGAKFNNQDTWTLKERRDGTAVVDVASKSEPADNATPLKMGATNITNQLTSTSSGTTEVDEMTGWIRKSDVLMKVNAKTTSVTRQEPPKTDVTNEMMFAGESRLRLEAIPVTAISMITATPNQSSVTTGTTPAD